jgi:hypothetical protein
MGALVRWSASSLEDKVTTSGLAGRGKQHRIKAYVGLIRREACAGQVENDKVTKCSLQ